MALNSGLRRAGDEKAGFVIVRDDSHNALHVDVWGFWDERLAAGFPSVVQDACREAIGVAALFLEGARLKPQSEGGQRALAAMLASLPAFGIKRVKITAVNPLTRLQLMRIAKESVARRIVEFDSEDKTEGPVGRRAKEQP